MTKSKTLFGAIRTLCTGLELTLVEKLKSGAMYYVYLKSDHLCNFTIKLAINDPNFNVFSEHFLKKKMHITLLDHLQPG